MLLLGRTAGIFGREAARPPFDGFLIASCSHVISLFERKLLAPVTHIKVTNEVFEYDTAPKTEYLLGFMSVLNKQEQIKEVTFNLKAMKRKDWDFIANGLLYNQSLSTLTFRADQLGEIGLSSFFTALCYNNSIEQFIVHAPTSRERQCITPNRIAELSTLVQVNKSLKSIDLSSFDLDHKSARWCIDSLMPAYFDQTVREHDDLPTIKLHLNGENILISPENVLDHSFHEKLKILTGPKPKM